MTVDVRLLCALCALWFAISEAEPGAQTCNTSGNDARDVAKRRTRLKVRIRRRRGVEHVEHVEVDGETRSGAERKILAAAKVQDVLRRQLFVTVGLEPQRRVAVLRDRRAAVGIDLPEDVGPLPEQAVPALQETGERYVSRQSIARAYIAGPRPRLVERVEHVVGTVEHRRDPAMILHHEVRHL